MRDTDTLASDDAQRLVGILACRAELTAARHRVGACAVMMWDRRCNRLPE